MHIIIDAAPPDSVVDLRFTAKTNTTIVVAWRNGFEGSNPITGHTLRYSVAGSGAVIQSVSLANSTTTFVLEGLMPFTLYAIAVSSSNIRGSGSAETIEVRTMSLRKFQVGSV